MTNLERLKQATNATNTSDAMLYKWLKDFVNWHDPGGWIDNDDIRDYLESKNSGFCVGDIIHLKESNTYGVVTYIDTELNWYCILMNSGKTLQHSCDFDTVEKKWELTDRRFDVPKALSEILPPTMRTRIK